MDSRNQIKTSRFTKLVDEDGDGVLIQLAIRRAIHLVDASMVASASSLKPF
jgi:hypothetical protein